MPTITKNEIRARLANAPTVVYPDEVVERFKKEAEIGRMMLATGQLYPQTTAELAAEFGISLD
ncbi:MAG: hypothetical protein LBC70_01915 [Chitinispirillales bacterium]|nr:hypothetical protein [Chitinispirillales bacterium]